MNAGPSEIRQVGEPEVRESESEKRSGGVGEEKSERDKPRKTSSQAANYAASSRASWTDEATI